jgi:N-acetylglutamate synthase-like GNAT family acetyltransferase
MGSEERVAVNRTSALNSIAVDPNHQRKGIGLILLKWGIDKAKEQNRDVYLVSTDAGRALYLSAGFEQMGVFEAFGEPQYQMILKISSKKCTNTEE